jgi:KaiC/GvpD/RAD55 family RecA-like ATPase
LGDEHVPVIVSPGDLAKKEIFLVLASPSTIRQRNIDLIKEISENGYHAVIITTNFPYGILTRLYSEQGVDLSRVSFIDAVTRNSLGNAENIPNVVRFINNPANLTDLGIAVTEVLRERSGQKVCILFDSISTMLIYLSSPNISKFIHFVTNKLRLMDISGIFLAVEKGLDPMLMTQLTTFVDTVIDTG